MDLPAPLSAAQRQELRVVLRQLQKQHDVALKEMGRLELRLTSLTSRRTRVEADLQLSNTQPSSAAVPLVSGEAGVVAADSSVPAWKRRREQQAAAETGAAQKPAQPDPERKSVLQRGSVFGMLQGVLNDAVKEQALVQGLDNQRLAAQRKVHTLQLDSELASIKSDLEAAQREWDLHASHRDAVAPNLKVLASVVDQMDEAEDDYCDSFFLRAQGATYSIPFQPAFHTEASKLALEDQIMTAAKEHVSGFRAEVDEAFRVIASLREQKRQNSSS
jgi:hypothetical protein